MFGESCSDSLVNGPSNRKKNFNKFLKFCHTHFWQLELATCSRLNLVMKIACFAQWGLFSEQFSKTFHFSLTYCDCSVSPSSKLTVFTHKTSIFFVISSPIFEKRYEFCHFLYVFFVSTPWFLGFWVLLSFEKYDIRIWWFGYILAELVIWVLLVLGVWCLHYMFSCLPLIFE